MDISEYQPESTSGASGKQTRTRAVSESQGRPRQVPVGDIAPNPYQPRRDFDPDELAQLADSIRTQGILQPLVVTPARDGLAADRPFILIAGERRLRAARLAGLESVPCILREADRQEMLELAIVENIHRSDLNPVEKAQAYRQYMDRFALTQAEAGTRLGQPRATLANYLRILDLCDDTRSLVAGGSLSFGHAKILAGLRADPSREAELARKAVAEGLSVRQLEELAGTPKPKDATDDKDDATPRRVKPPLIRDLEERLSRCVGTRVQVLTGRSQNAGRIVLDYYSLDDFDRISTALGLEPEG